MACLHFRWKESIGALPVDSNARYLGRSEFPSPYVSQHHGLLFKITSKWHLLDPGSTAGIYLNGRKLEANKAYPLTESDRIQLGNFDGAPRLIWFEDNCSESTLLGPDVWEGKGWKRKQRAIATPEAVRRVEQLFSADLPEGSYEGSPQISGGTTVMERVADPDPEPDIEQFSPRPSPRGRNRQLPTMIADSLQSNHQIYTRIVLGLVAIAIGVISVQFPGVNNFLNIRHEESDHNYYHQH